MIKIYHPPLPFSPLQLESDGEFLTRLCFVNQTITENNHLPIFDETIEWLDEYFSGIKPCFTPRYRLGNMSPFRKTVLDIISQIPYGKTLTYGEIATQVAQIMGKDKMSAQAVGGATGANPIGIIIPCHRVMGAHNKITGYGGGIKNKELLLRLEGVEIF